MVKISEEEYRTLELRIQAEVKRIFAEFLEDLEQKNADSGETVPGRESQQSGTLPEPEPAPSVSAVDVPRKRCATKKVTEMRKLLGGLLLPSRNPRAGFSKKIWRKFSEEKPGEGQICRTGRRRVC